MFDIGFTELLIVGVVALIVVGPKDLPGMFRTLGRMTARARQLSREFTRAMNDVAEESGMNEAASALKTVTKPGKTGLNALKTAADRFDNWDPTDKVKAAAAAAKSGDAADTTAGAAKDTAKPSYAPGSETAKLAEERAEQARKYRELAAQKAEERIARENRQAEKAAAAGDGTPLPTPARVERKTQPRNMPVKRAGVKKAPGRTAPKRPIPRPTGQDGS